MTRQPKVRMNQDLLKKGGLHRTGKEFRQSRARMKLVLKHEIKNT